MVASNNQTLDGSWESLVDRWKQLHSKGSFELANQFYYDELFDTVVQRFKDNFSDYYGSWVANYNDKDRPFQNFYLVRNPQATNDAFNMKNGSETWRSGFKKSRDVLYNAFNKPTQKALEDPRPDEAGASAIVLI